MAAVSFTRPAPKTEPKKVEPPKVEVPAAAPTMAVARSTSSQLEGEFTSKDMAVPYLSLGQKTGAMTDEHPDWLGKYVYDKMICLGDSIRIVIFRISKFYEENLPFGSEDIPRRFDKIEEAKAEGVDVRDCANIDMLIEADGEESEFGQFTIDGKSYVPARYTVRSTAYGATVRIVVRDMAGWLKNDLSSGFYLMTTEKRTGPKGSWFVPRLKTDGKVSEELRGAIAERLG